MRHITAVVLNFSYSTPLLCVQDKPRDPQPKLYHYLHIPSKVINYKLLFAKLNSNCSFLFLFFSFYIVGYIDNFLSLSFGFYECNICKCNFGNISTDKFVWTPWAGRVFIMALKNQRPSFDERKYINSPGTEAFINIFGNN